MSADGAPAGARAAPALSTRNESPGGAQVTLAGARVILRPSGALFWPDEGLLGVGDLHLGRAERLARAGASLLPPYETIDTLDRLAAEIAALDPSCVVCLGDSFDDLAAAGELADETVARIAGMAAGRRWIWIAGNHDPDAVDLPGAHRCELAVAPLAFRHIARPGPLAGGEVSAHFHPRARLKRRGILVTRRCFLADSQRAILPAFGTYTGGLDAWDAAFDGLLGPDAWAFLTGRDVSAMPRSRLRP